jgi:hypothetical protein
MHEVCIFKGSGPDGFALKSRHVMRKLFLGFTIDTVSPLKGDVFQLRVTGNFGMEVNGSIRVIL